MIWQASSLSVQVQLASTGTHAFTGLATLTVEGLPSGVTASFDPKTISAFQTGTLRLTASSTATLGTATLIVRAQQGTLVRTGRLTLTVEANAGATGVRGRFITPEGNGIGGVIVRADIDPNTQPTTTTDPAGNFQLVNLPAGQVTLRFDATPANPLYPIWPATVTLQPNTISALEDWVINPPPPDERFTPINNATQDQKITDARYPGLEITLPAGVRITGWDGVVKTRIAVERIDPDRTGVPPPPVPTKSMYQLYFGTPMGGYPSAPIPVQAPNDGGLEPGQKTEIWYFDGAPTGAGTGAWKRAGTATVSADGAVVKMDAGQGIPRFCGKCGLWCVVANLAGQLNFAGCGSRAGNPVTLASGQELPDEADLSIDGVMPIEIGRTFNPFDPYANIAGVQLSMGQGWAFSYDVTLLVLGNDLVRVILPGNARTDFTRDTDGQLKAKGDPRYEGAVLSGAGANYSLRFADGSKWDFSQIGFVHYLMTETDGVGNELLLRRNADGRIIGIQAGDRSVAVVPNTDGFISEIRDALGRTIRYSYNAQRRLDTVTDTAGGVTRYTYVDDSEFPPMPACPSTPGGVRIKTALYAGQTVPVDNLYGPGRRVLRQLMPDGSETKLSYKLVGACVTHVNSPGVRCSGASCPTADSWENFQAGWRISGGTVAETTVTDARGITATSRFNARGLDTELTDALGQKTRLAIDQATNRVTGITDALNRTARYAYDARGNVSRVTDHTGRNVEFAYDPRSNKVARLTVYGDGGQALTTTYQYDPNTGNLLSVTDPKGRATAFAYTSKGQVSAITDARGKVSRFEYNSSGDLTKVVNPLGNEVNYTADAVGRSQSMTDPRGFSTSYALNARDQVTTITDPEGRSTTIGYDARGNIGSVTDRQGQTVAAYTHDALNRVKTRTDAAGKQDLYDYDGNGNLTGHADRAGQDHRFTYDPLDRMVEARLADGSVVRLAYDAIGRLAAISDQNGTVGYVYDELDRVVQVSTPQGVLKYAYDVLDRVIRFEKPAGVETYRYDEVGNLIEIKRGGDTYSFAYDELDRRRELQLPNGVKAEYAYDDASRLTSITYSRSGAVLEQLTYSYDLAGNIVTKNRAGVASLGETAFTATYDAANRMTGIAIGGKTYALTYDDKGNLIRREAQGASANTTTYTWDSRNRLTQIASPTVNATFRYDVLGRRVERIVNGEQSVFLYDGDQAVTETGPAGTVDYLTGTSIDEVLARYSQSGDRWLLADHLGSVLAMTDDAGSVRGAYIYSPYGEVQPLGVIDPNPLQYTGRENDQTGILYYRARYYDPSLKRFISEDPIGIDGGMNVYQYVLGDPVNYNDPSGEILPAVAAAVRVALAACAHFPVACRTAVQQIVRWLRGCMKPGASPGPKSGTGSGAPTPAPKAGNAKGGDATSSSSAPSPSGAPSANTPAPNTPKQSTPSNAQPGNAPGSSQAPTSASAPGGSPASTPVGRRGAPLEVQPGTNAPANIAGRQYTGHALDRMQGRGLTPRTVENTINTGRTSPGNQPGTTRYYDPVNKINVTTDTQSGRVITAF